MKPSLFRNGVEVRLRIFKDFWSCTTHFAGLIGAIVGGILLLVFCLPGAAAVTSASIFGASLVLLFAASTTYHFLDIGERGNRWLRRFDHMSIFFLIGGSYVPALVLLLDGTWRVALLGAVGTLAVGGALMKLFWIDCPDKLSTCLYLAFGWFGVIPVLFFMPKLTSVTAALLVTGGLVYSVGALVYMKQWPDPWPNRFGHHEVWHLLVLMGASLHWCFVAKLVTAPLV